MRRFGHVVRTGSGAVTAIVYAPTEDRAACESHASSDSALQKQQVVHVLPVRKVSIAAEASYGLGPPQHRNDVAKELRAGPAQPPADELRSVEHVTLRRGELRDHLAALVDRDVSGHHEADIRMPGGHRHHLRYKSRIDDIVVA